MTRLDMIELPLESCAGRFNSLRLRVPAFAGRVWKHAEQCMRVRIELDAGQVGRGIKTFLCRLLNDDPTHVK